MGGKKPLLSRSRSLTLSISVSLSRRPRRNCLTRRSYRSCVFPLAILFSHPTSSAFTVEKGNLTGSKTPSSRTSFTSPAARCIRAGKDIVLSLSLYLSTRDRESVSLPTKPASQAASHLVNQPAACASIEIVCRDRAARNIEY